MQHYFIINPNAGAVNSCARITEEVKKIKAPTLLVWGTNDEAVSIERAYELEKLIPDAGLVVYENATHYAYLENLGQTINVMKSFLN